MFIITFSPFNIYDDVLCARVCACAYYEERSGGRFLPLSAAQFFLSASPGKVTYKSPFVIGNKARFFG